MTANFEARCPRDTDCQIRLQPLESVSATPKGDHHYRNDKQPSFHGISFHCCFVNLISVAELLTIFSRSGSVSKHPARHLSTQSPVQGSTCIVTVECGN